MEIRFESTNREFSEIKRRVSMTIARSSDDGVSWQDIPTSLFWWNALAHMDIWPPHPFDLVSFKVTGEHGYEAVISDFYVDSASDGSGMWKATYHPNRRRWKIRKISGR